MTDFDSDQVDLPTLPVAAPVPAAAPPPTHGVMTSAIAVAALMVIAAIIGFGVTSASLSDKSFSRATETTPTTQAPSVGGGNAGTPSTDPQTSELSKLILRQEDVAQGFTVQLAPNGQNIGLSSTTATLDLCNGKFPSDQLRTARRQVYEVDPQGDSPLSTEAVLYRTAEQSKQAFAELRHVRATCPRTAVKSPVGEPTVITTFNNPPDRGWATTPNVERLAYDFISIETSSNGDTTHSVAVYLRRGRALMGLYFSEPTGQQPAVAGQTSLESIEHVFEQRLAALPASVVS